MADARDVRDEPAHGVVRSRGAARGGGDGDPGPLPVAATHRVTVFHAADCGLCARAIEIVEALREDVPFELELVDIGGDDDLEVRYRVLLPVVEIDGEVAFTYFVDRDALGDRLRSVVPAPAEDP